MPGGRPGEFVGLEVISGDAPAGDVHHSIPGFARYQSVGVVEIPSSPEIRRAIAKGDLEEVLDDEGGE